MSLEPAFPIDAFGTHDSARAAPPPPSTVTAPIENDDRPVAAAGEASAVEVVAAIDAVKSKLWPAAGVAIGVGSAAIAAALLYRSRR